MFHHVHRLARCNLVRTRTLGDTKQITHSRQIRQAFSIRGIAASTCRLKMKPYTRAFKKRLQPQSEDRRPQSSFYGSKLSVVPCVFRPERKFLTSHSHKGEPSRSSLTAEKLPEPHRRPTMTTDSLSAIAISVTTSLSSVPFYRGKK